MTLVCKMQISYFEPPNYMYDCPGWLGTGGFKTEGFVCDCSALLNRVGIRCVCLHKLASFSTDLFTLRLMIAQCMPNITLPERSVSLHKVACCCSIYV